MIHEDKTIIIAGYLSKSPTSRVDGKLRNFFYRLFRIRRSENIFDQRWKKQYCVLYKLHCSNITKVIFEYFKDESLSNRKGRVDLENCIDVIGIQKDGRWTTEFSVHSVWKGKDRVCYFSAESVTRMLEWVKQLRHVLSLGDPTSVPVTPLVGGVQIGLPCATRVVGAHSPLMRPSPVNSTTYHASNRLESLPGQLYPHRKDFSPIKTSNLDKSGYKEVPDEIDHITSRAESNHDGYYRLNSFSHSYENLKERDFTNLDSQPALLHELPAPPALPERPKRTRNRGENGVGGHTKLAPITARATGRLPAPYPSDDVINGDQDCPYSNMCETAISDDFSSLGFPKPVPKKPTLFSTNGARPQPNFPNTCQNRLSSDYQFLSSTWSSKTATLPVVSNYHCPPITLAPRPPSLLHHHSIAPTGAQSINLSNGIPINKTGTMNSQDNFVEDSGMIALPVRASGGHADLDSSPDCSSTDLNTNHKYSEQSERRRCSTSSASVDGFTLNIPVEVEPISQTVPGEINSYETRTTLKAVVGSASQTKNANSVPDQLQPHQLHYLDARNLDLGQLHNDEHSSPPRHLVESDLDTSVALTTTISNNSSTTSTTISRPSVPPRLVGNHPTGISMVATAEDDKIEYREIDVLSTNALAFVTKRYFDDSDEADA